MKSLKGVLEFSFLLFVLLACAGVILLRMLPLMLGTLYASPSPSPVISTPIASHISSPMAQQSAPTETRLPENELPTPTYPPITWQALNDFLASDHTNWNRYDVQDYTCLNYAHDLVKNARAANIEAFIIAVGFRDEQAVGHAFVAFPTTDLGMVYIEPQGDNRYMDLGVGSWLCDAWGMYECMGIVESIEQMDCDDSGTCSSEPYEP